MPPLRYFEEYLELITAIEDTAADLGFPVLIEGYTPPYDPRVHHIKVTPDPGVIEVNTQPVESWNDLVRNNSYWRSYEAVRFAVTAARKHKETEMQTADVGPKPLGKMSGFVALR